MSSGLPQHNNRNQAHSPNSKSSAIRTSMMDKNCFLLVFLFVLQQAGSALCSGVNFKEDKDGTIYITSDVGKDIIIQPGHGGRVIINGHLQVCEGDKCMAKLGSVRNPALSCKAILKDEPFAPSGVYYIQTHPTITKVYCYMNHINGCGGGGWTTVMKTNGHKPTFTYASALWQDKIPYNMTGGQSGVDHLETKLPTYWTMPFNSLCLGMKNTSESVPNWIRLNYKASSLYSVIADARYRSFSIGRSAWKSLIPGSSLQQNCNREGFNLKKYQFVRIGITSNQENDCLTPDSRIGFGGAGLSCNTDDSISTGNTATLRCDSDNGDKNLRSHGYILAQ